MTDPGAMFQAVFMVLCLLGTFHAPYWYSFHLLQMVKLNETLKNVVRAVIVPFEKLAHTFMLMVFVMFIFSIIGFFFFRSGFMEDGASFEENQCRTLLQCDTWCLRPSPYRGCGTR